MVKHERYLNVVLHRSLWLCYHGLSFLVIRKLVSMQPQSVVFSKFSLTLKLRFLSALCPWYRPPITRRLFHHRGNATKYRIHFPRYYALRYAGRVWTTLLLNALTFLKKIKIRTGKKLTKDVLRKTLVWLKKGNNKVAGGGGRNTVTTTIC